MSLKRFWASLAVSALATTMVACGGGSNKQVAVPDGPGQGSAGLGGGSAGTDCKASKCDPANADVSGSFGTQGGLVGYVGDPVNWEFFGVDRNTMNANQQSSARTIAVLLDKVPEGSTISPEPSSGKVAQRSQVTWTPDRELKGKLDIILRDYDRCVAKEGEDRCNKYVYIKEYDTKLPDIPWQIVDKNTVQDSVSGSNDPNQNVVTVGNPNCGPTPTSNSDITGKLIGTGMQVLTNPNSLGPVLLQAVMGGIAGGGSSNPDPTEC